MIRRTTYSRRIAMMGAVAAITFGMSLIAAPAQAAEGDAAPPSTVAAQDAAPPAEPAADTANGTGTPPVASPAPDSTVAPDAVLAPEPASAAAAAPAPKPAAVEGITPNPVTFPDACTIIVPETEGVTYSVKVPDSDPTPISAGTYDSLEFGLTGTIAFIATASGEVPLAEGATVSWSYEATADCVSNATLVKVTTKCSNVTFKNLTDLELFILYGANFMEDPEGVVDLDPHASKTIKKIASDGLYFLAIQLDEELLQFGTLTVSRNCPAAYIKPKHSVKKAAVKVAHPTVAPAAGR